MIDGAQRTGDLHKAPVYGTGGPPRARPAREARNRTAGVWDTCSLRLWAVDVGTVAHFLVAYVSANLRSSSPLGIDSIASSVSVVTNTSNAPMCDLCGAPPYITVSIAGELRGLYARCAWSVWTRPVPARSSGDDSD